MMSLAAGLCLHDAGDVLEEDADLDNLAKTGNTPVNESKDPKTARAKARERRRKKRATQIVYWLETKYDVLHQAACGYN
eukprot:4824573-Amphidinium_carterae.1